MFKNIVTALQQLRYTLVKHTTKNFVVDCNAIKPGVFRCKTDALSNIVALYTISGNIISIKDLSLIDATYHVKRILDLFSIPGCETITYFSLKPVDIDNYISKINHKLQMKLVELELDKSNTKLRSYVERLIDTRRRVLKGIKPIDISSIIAFICNDSQSYIEILSSIEHSAKNSMNIELKPVTDPMKAVYIANFREGKT
uniref:Uncharacterized protein n=1 Tax=Ignisphaera aggregans TaxID=334771 RepID=A0A7C5XNI5_9CREN